MAVPRPVDVLAALGPRPGAVLLDGGAWPGSWSLLGWDPDEVVTDGADWPTSGRRLTRGEPPGRSPFAGGVLGYVGYEAGWRVEAVPRGRQTPEPEVFLGRYPGAIAWQDGRLFVEGSRAFVRDATRLVTATRAAPPPPPAPEGAGSGTSRADYLAAIARIRRWIEEGDCYQVNLSRVLRAPTSLGPLAAWQRLQAAARAAYGAFVQTDDATAVLCASPELLLAAADGEIISHPIKGTRPRAGGERARADLEQSEKDAAELAMIVDLVRNDLHRVAVPGSLTVGPRQVTAHPSVFHTHRQVRGTLRPGADAWAALAALFPPGSVVGAPKVRAAERIRDLEPEPRGVYCGTIGFVSADGRAVWNVAIRTGVHHAGSIRYHVGGGVVIDSDPDAEWEETVHKGEGLATALGVFTPPG